MGKMPCEQILRRSAGAYSPWITVTELPDQVNKVMFGTPTPQMGVTCSPRLSLPLIGIAVSVTADMLM